MDASTAASEHERLEVIVQMTSRLESQAQNGEWENVENLVARIRSSVQKISDHGRSDAIHAVMQVLERVQTLALVSRHDVSDKLAELQRGRVAVQAYDHFAGQSVASALR